MLYDGLSVGVRVFDLKKFLCICFKYLFLPQNNLIPYRIHFFGIVVLNI